MQKGKVFEVEFWPQFRDADHDAKIGLRGIMNYFQDITSHQMFELEFGNYFIRNNFNKVWFITKYKLVINERIEFGDKLTMKAWIDEQSSPVLMNQSFCVARGEKIYAYGRVELCLVDLTTEKLSKLSSIEFPHKYADVAKFEDVKFGRIKNKIENKEYCYEHIVRYNDIDETNHMNNLAYVSMIVNVFDTEFFKEHEIGGFEIHYVNQCFEGDKIKIYKEIFEDNILIFGEKEDGSVAVKCQMNVK